MADLEAARRYVVENGSAVERARLAWITRGEAPVPDVLAEAEAGQTGSGGWPAAWSHGRASVDATCLRLVQLDDLGAIRGTAGRRALSWLRARQRRDGTWRETAIGGPPPWLNAGPSSTLHLTANTGFCLAIANEPDRYGPRLLGQPIGRGAAGRAANAVAALWDPQDFFLVSAWLAVALLHWARLPAEADRFRRVIARRKRLSAADAAWLGAALRRVGLPPSDPLVAAAGRRLAKVQRADGSWPSDDGEAFDVHVTLTAFRALL